MKKQNRKKINKDVTVRSLSEKIDKRFEQVDKRFDKMMKVMDNRFGELYSFLQKHMVTKEEFNERLLKLENRIENIEQNYSTKDDLLKVKDELLTLMDKIINDYKKDKQEHAFFSYHLERIAKLEYRIDKIEGKKVKDLKFTNA